MTLLDYIARFGCCRVSDLPRDLRPGAARELKRLLAEGKLRLFTTGGWKRGTLERKSPLGWAVYPRETWYAPTKESAAA